MAVEALGTVGKGLELVGVVVRMSTANKVFNKRPWDMRQNIRSYIPLIAVLPADFCFTDCFFLGALVASMDVDG